MTRPATAALSRAQRPTLTLTLTSPSPSPSPPEPEPDPTLNPGGGALSPAQRSLIAGWQGGWAHGSDHQRVLFCEVGEARAAFTSRLRLLYAPRIRPISKGGATDPRHNYQANKHHASYWKPLQLYDLEADAQEQRNLLSPSERWPATPLVGEGPHHTNTSSSPEASALREEGLAMLQQLLSTHMDLSTADRRRECTT